MRVKGTAIRSRLEFVVHEAGEGARQAILEALGPEDRRALERVLPTSWIPVECVDRLDAELCRRLGRADVARAYGAYSAQRNLSRIYRSFVDQAGGDPLRLLEGLTPLHATFYDEGAMQTVDAAADGCCVEIDFAGCAARFRCQVSIGFIEEALRMVGLVGLQVSERECQVEGGARCRFELRWPAAQRAASLPRFAPQLRASAPSPSASGQ